MVRYLGCNVPPPRQVTSDAFRLYAVGGPRMLFQTLFYLSVCANQLTHLSETVRSCLSATVLNLIQHLLSGTCAGSRTGEGLSSVLEGAGGVQGPLPDNVATDAWRSNGLGGRCRVLDSPRLPFPFQDNKGDDDCPSSFLDFGNSHSRTTKLFQPLTSSSCSLETPLLHMCGGREGAMVIVY